VLTGLLLMFRDIITIYCLMSTFTNVNEVGWGQRRRGRGGGYDVYGDVREWASIAIPVQFVLSSSVTQGLSCEVRIKCMHDICYGSN